MTRRATASGLAVLLTLAACGRTAPPANPNAQLRSGALARSNLLLVTIDTLRTDRVGAYSGGPLTPAIDRLAARGVRFTNAHAHAPMTLPAHTSIFTGLTPPSHGVRNNGSTALSTRTPTLATLLHDAGYRTGAFVGAFVLDARFGLSRGFDAYDDAVGSDTGPVTFAFAERTADRVTQLAGDWITSTPAAANQPWFAWIHLFDPHAPYRAAEQRAANPYDNEVAFADAELGRLFDRLREARLLDSTLVALLADHGESLGEHGEETHGLFAYEATVRIPLIVAGPSIGQSVSDASVAQMDVLPTLVDLLGVAAPSVDGRSLLPAIRGEPWPSRPVYFEALDANLTRNWAPLTGVMLDGWKYIDLPDAELYDLAADPGEQRNVIRDHADRAAAMTRQLADLRRRPSEPSRPAPIDADAAARLRSLGYASGGRAAPNDAPRTSADDPKRLLDLDRRYEEALKRTGAGDFAQAQALLEGVIATRPDFAVAYLNLASVFLASGQPGRAVALLEAAAARGISTPELQGRLGSAYLAAGDAPRAVAALEPIARPELPGGLEAMNTLAVALTGQRRFDRARQLLSAVLERSPRSATTWSNLGILELSAGRPADAARAFERAVAADPRLGQAWEGLGAARVQSNPAGAIDAWKHAADLEPRNYDVLFNLAATLHDEHRDAEARPYIDRFVREAPPERYARDIAMLRGWLAR